MLAIIIGLLARYSRKLTRDTTALQMVNQGRWLAWGANQTAFSKCLCTEIWKVGKVVHPRNELVDKPFISIIIQLVSYLQPKLSNGWAPTLERGWSPWSFIDPILMVPPLDTPRNMDALQGRAKPELIVLPPSNSHFTSYWWTTWAPHGCWYLHLGPSRASFPSAITGSPVVHHGSLHRSSAGAEVLTPYLSKIAKLEDGRWAQACELDHPCFLHNQLATNGWISHLPLCQPGMAGYKWLIRG